MNTSVVRSAMAGSYGSGSTDRAVVSSGVVLFLLVVDVTRIVMAMSSVSCKTGKADLGEHWEPASEFDHKAINTQLGV